MAKKVLIVEDYDDVRELMKIIVESFGCDVIEAANGIDAIMCVKSEIPNLILMDIGLPGMDGITATKIIREYLNGIEIPIVVITAFDKSYQQDAIKAGCNCVMRKPVEFDSLASVLNQYLIRNSATAASFPLSD